MFFLRKLTAAGGGETVIAGAAIVFGVAPFGGDPIFLLHAMERGIQRAFFDAEDFIRYFLDVQRDAPAVHWAVLEGFQNEQR